MKTDRRGGNIYGAERQDHMTAENFPRRFATAFTAQDERALAALIAAEGTLQSITGVWAESPEEIESAFAGEAAGIFARARLVTGRGQIRPLGPTTALLRQRYTVSGALDESGAELPRFGAMLVAVLEAAEPEWKALSLTFLALP